MKELSTAIKMLFRGPCVILRPINMYSCTVLNSYHHFDSQVSDFYALKWCQKHVYVLRKLDSILFSSKRGHDPFGSSYVINRRCIYFAYFSTVYVFVHSFFSIGLSTITFEFTYSEIISKHGSPNTRAGIGKFFSDKARF